MFSNDFIFYVESFEEAVSRSKKEPQGLRDSNLWSAIINGNLEEAKIAVLAGASLTTPSTSKQKPLILAALYGRTAIVKFLLNKGADPRISNDDGNTALHWAAAFGYVDICKMLVKKGADPNRQAKSGVMAKHMAYGWSKDTQKMFDNFMKMLWFVALPVDLKRIKVDRGKVIRLFE